MKNIFKRIASMIACFACIVSISTNAYARSYSVDKRGEYTEVITGGDSKNNSITLCEYNRSITLPALNRVNEFK